jgi:hypothetical protein
LVDALPQKTTRVSILHPLRLAVLFGAAAGLAGCTEPARILGVTSLPVDSSSPVAKDVIAASQRPGPFPHFAEIPKTPTDIRPVSAWHEAVTDLQQRQAVLVAEVAALPPAPTDTEAFAAAARQRAAAPALATPPAADAEEQAKAYAKALRERATPPPSPR